MVEEGEEGRGGIEATDITICTGFTYCGSKGLKLSPEQETGFASHTKLFWVIGHYNA